MNQYYLDLLNEIKILGTSNIHLKTISGKYIDTHFKLNVKNENIYADFQSILISKPNLNEEYKKLLTFHLFVSLDGLDLYSYTINIEKITMTCDPEQTKELYFETNHTGG